MILLSTHKNYRCHSKVEHVTDVHIDQEASVEQGIFIAQYNDNNELGPLTKLNGSAIWLAVMQNKVHNKMQKVNFQLFVKQSL